MSNLAQASLIAGGLFNMGFAVFHLMFWRFFDWKADLASLTAVNRSVMQILNLCLTFLLLVMGYVSLFHGHEMLSTGLGRTLLGAIALFWLPRMLEQILVFEVRNRLSALFALIFLLGGVLYVLPLF